MKDTLFGPAALVLLVGAILAPNCDAQEETPSIVNFYHTTAGDSVKFIVIATGSEPLSYQWYWEGQPIPGANTSILSYTNAATTANAGYYSVTVSNASGVVSTPPPGLLFIKSMQSGTYYGIFYDEHYTAVESSGSFQFSLSGTKKTYSGKLTRAGASYRFSGAFSAAHASVTTSAPGTDGKTLDLQFHLITTNGNSSVIGRVSGGNWSVPLRGNRAAYGKQNPATLAGQYTLALNNVTLLLPGAQPQGNGCFSVKVGQSGSAKLSGRAADGTTLSAGSYLSKEDEFPFYVSLYQNQGCLVGWLSFGTKTNTEWADYFETLPEPVKELLPSAGEMAQGSLHGSPIRWVKNSSNSGSYPNGFSTILQPIGSKYQKSGGGSIWDPSPVVDVLPFQKGVAAFALGDLFSAELSKWDFVRVSVPKMNTIKAESGPEKLQLSVGKSEGFLSGSFIHPDTGIKTAIRGVLLQEQGYALGYFLSSGTSGYFALVPSGEQ